MKDEGTKKLGNEGAYLPPNRYGMTPQKYWDVAEATIKLLASKGVLNPKDQGKVLAAVQHRITPMQELETISSGDLIEKYKDIANQVVEFDGLHTGSPTLDAYLLGVQPKNFMVIGARTGVGKCHRKGTRVLMADGTTKKIEDIAIGEFVQGIGAPRKVLGKHSGFGRCYKICPKKGDPFYVSDSHIMTCMRYKEKYSHRKVVGMEHLLEDIAIEDLMTKKKHADGTFTHYKLYRPTIEYPTKKLSLDPYILGVWLGDGSASETAITTMDAEVRDRWLEQARALDMQCRRTTRVGSKATTYHLYTARGQNNPLLDIFRQLGILENKHIPLEYLTGDRQQRLALLAGLLDTDGYLSHGVFEITQKRLLLAQQIAQLARGLGLSVTHRTKIVNGAEYQRLFISGDVSFIPTLVPRRHAKQRTMKKDPLVTGFRIEQVEDSEYCGIMVDGDQRYLLWDNTATHNTLVANFMIANFACQKEKILYLALEESEEEVGSRWAKVVLNNHLEVPKDSVHFAYAEMISAIKEDKYNLIPILSVYAQLGFTMVAVDMLNNLIDTVRDEDGNVFLNRLVSAVQNSGMTLVMTTRLRQPITDMEKDFPTMDSVYGRVDLGYVVSKCIALTQLDDVGDGNTYLRVHILKNRRKQIGMPLTYPILKVSNLLEISDTGNDNRAEELRKAYEANGGHKPKPPKDEDADKTTHLAKDANF